jgi:hypothetical protein
VVHTYTHTHTHTRTHTHTHRRMLIPHNGWAGAAAAAHKTGSPEKWYTHTRIHTRTHTHTHTHRRMLIPHSGWAGAAAAARKTDSPEKWYTSRLRWSSAGSDRAGASAPGFSCKVVWSLKFKGASAPGCSCKIMWSEVLTQSLSYFSAKKGFAGCQDQGALGLQAPLMLHTVVLQWLSFVHTYITLLYTQNPC